MYNGGIPYISPIEAWINNACQRNPSPWHPYQGFQAHTVIRFSSPVWRNILVRTWFVIDEVLSWIASKDKGKISHMNCLLGWLH